MQPLKRPTRTPWPTRGKGADEGERLMALGALAESQMRQAKVKEATATVEQLSKAAPNNPMVKLLKGQVAAAGGNLDEARMLLEEAVAAMPDNMHARTVLGVINMQQGNLGQAEMHFSTVLTKDPKNVEAQKLLAATRAQLQSPEKSLQGMQSALDRRGRGPVAARHGGPHEPRERQPRAGARLPHPGLGRARR